MSSRNAPALSRGESIRRLPPRAARGRDWNRIDNKAGDEADVYLYDLIGFWGTTAAEFASQIAALDVGRIVLHLNSPGGEAWDGQAIYHVLRDHPAEVEVRVEGIAASAASTVAMAGDRVVMAKHAMMMIHDPWMITLGDARDHQKSAESLDKLGDAIAGFYADRAGGSVREWRDRMLEETWYSDREAVDAGLADEVAGDDAAASDRFDRALFDFLKFKHTPEHLIGGSRDGERPATKRDAERALRDAGLSAAAAKAVIANGWREQEGGARDARGLEELLGTIRALSGGNQR